MDNHYCDCEREGNCTATTMCYVQTVVSDLKEAHEIEIERLKGTIEIIQANRHKIGLIKRICAQTLLEHEHGRE